MSAAEIPIETTPPQLVKGSTWLAASVWGLGAFFYFYEIMLIVAPSVMDAEIMEAFSITSAEKFGTLAGSYFIPYAFMQIPVGLLMDRYGPRILLTVASALCALGCLMLATAHLYYMGIIARVLMGIGGSFAVVGCLKLASIWFPINRFALLTGIMVAVGMMGGVVGQTLVAKFVATLGWRETLMYGAVIGGLLSVAIAVIMSKKSPCQQETLSICSPSLQSVLKGLWQVMSSKQVWIASIFAAFLYMPTTGFGQLWGIPYLKARFGVTSTDAGFIMALIFIGWAFGGPIFGWISDRIGKRKSPMWIASFGTLLVMLLMMYAPISIFGVKVSLFFLGALSSGFILAFSVVRELGTHQNTGTAIGFINTLNNLSGLVAQPVIGYLLDLNYGLAGGAVDIAKQPVYSVEIFNNALLFIPVCLLLAAILLPFLKETNCRPAIYEQKY